LLYLHPDSQMRYRHAQSVRGAIIGGCYLERCRRSYLTQRTVQFDHPVQRTLDRYARSTSLLDRIHSEWRILRLLWFTGTGFSSVTAAAQRWETGRSISIIAS